MIRTSAARALVDGYRDRPDASARRLIVTIFGDSIAPRGGAVWLSTLIALMEPFGIGDRLVRTSVQRLVAEGVLTNERIGRRSRYALTEAARVDARAADRRIYHPPADDWAGAWTLLVATSPEPAPDIVQRLRWRGFGEVRPGVHASPVIDTDTAARVRDELDASEELMVLRATSLDEDRRLAASAFDLDDIGSAYEAVSERYEARGLDGLRDDLAFAVRTLLVDDFRRVVLREPELPAELLPESWAGTRARRVAGEVYRSVSDAADRHLDAVAGTDGALPAPASWARARFTTI